MTGGGRLELVSQARENVARVIGLLERPSEEALDDSGVELVAAVARMQQIQNAGPGGGASLKAAILALRSDLDRARLLLNSAWEFRVGLTGQAGYSNAGALTLPEANGRRRFFEA
jgi:hypothetical protein